MKSTIKNFFCIVNIMAMLALCSGCTDENSLLYTPNSDFEENEQSINFAEFEKLIWIDSEYEDGDGYYYPLSLFFTSLNDSDIQGHLSMGTLAEPAFFHNCEFEATIYRNWFSGKIKNGIAFCEFEIDDDVRGYLTIDLNDSSQLMVTAEFSEMHKVYEDYKKDTYILKPFNLSDIKNIVEEQELRIETELNSWGNVVLIKEEIKTSRVCYSAIYLVDRDDNILYSFNGGFITGFEIFEIIIRDFNSDLYNDICVKLRPINRDEYYHENRDDTVIEMYFFQLEDGLFYISE